MKNKEKKSNNVSIILCLLVIFTCIVIRSMSKYTSSLFNESVVEIANFVVNSDVNEETKSFELTGLYPGSSKTLNFAVTNDSEGKISEVGSKYSIEIEHTDNLPLTFNIEIDNEKTSDTGTTVQQSSAKSKNIWNGGILPHSTSTTHTYKLTVSWEESEDNIDYSEEIDMVLIKVNSQQID